MDIKELRNQSIEELQVRAEEINKELFELRSKLALEKKLDKPHLIKMNKRTKARILTVLQEKKAG